MGTFLTWKIIKFSGGESVAFLVLEMGKINTVWMAWINELQKIKNLFRDEDSKKIE